MITIELPSDIEQQFREVVQESYHGNIQEAFSSFLRLHEKYGWKEVETHNDGSMEKLHLETAKRRRDELRSGGVQPIDGEEGLKRVRSKG